MFNIELYALEIQIFALLLFLCDAQICFEEDKCIAPTNGTGKCIRFSKCEFALNLIENKKNPGLCGFVEKNIPLVCCPDPDLQSRFRPGDLSKQSCKRFYDHEIVDTSNPNRGRPFVTGGVKVEGLEFPHMAAVGYNDLESKKIVWLCGGSLISYDFVLSAAHCACHIQHGSAQWIRLGDLNLESSLDDDKARNFQINAIYIHPNYTFPSTYHDIAIIKMNTSFYFVTFSHACLHTEKNLPMTTLEAAGWGALNASGPKSNELMKVDLEIIGHEKCAGKYVKHRKLKSGILDEIQLCAGDSNGVKDTCAGDSGGPLHYVVNVTQTTDRHFVIAGVTSFGYACGGTVAVYTRVSAYIDWIEDVVWKNDPKLKTKLVENCF